MSIKETHPEWTRIRFMIEEYGIMETLKWAKQTKAIYRTAVLNKNHHASLPEYRRSFIESYLILKRWIEP